MPQVSSGLRVLLAAVLTFLTICAGHPTTNGSEPITNGSSIAAPITAANSTNSSGFSSLQDLYLHGYAEECRPPRLAKWPMSLPSASVMSNKKLGRPNFIVILLDDRGFDDIGLHHPRGPDGKISAGAQTPNIDKFIKSGTSFTNFYTGPLCATTRAQLLTGRDYVRTGNLYNSRGFDGFSLQEATAGDVMKQAGYKTAHFGKWHNGNTAGYESWNRGFDLGVIPGPYVHVDNLMRVNGEYQPTKGLMEQVLMDKLLGYVKERETDKKPFFVYYAPYSVHGVPGWVLRSNANASAESIYEPYLSKIMAVDPTVSKQTAQFWSRLMYIDDVLGRLFDHINNSTLKDNTYIMLTSDNGGELPGSVYRDIKERLRRMPSGMLGNKNYVEPSLGSSGTEGGLRNHLAVAGPGVPAGLVDNTLLSASDILPTVAEMGGATNTKHMPWSGISFANLLKPDGKPTDIQKERFLFTLTTCPYTQNFMQHVLLDLQADRRVLKTQPTLAYANATGSYMKKCIVGRFKEFKWFGHSNQIFRLVNDSHIELSCNALGNTKEKNQLHQRFNVGAFLWWKEVLAEPHSFEKPVYQLGHSRWKASNVEAVGAVEVIGGNVYLSSNAAINFTQPGDGICAKVTVMTAGRYKVVATIDSACPAYFKLGIGVREDIRRAKATYLEGKLPSTQHKLVVKSLGELRLNDSKGATESVCFRLVTMEAGDPACGGLQPNFRLMNLRFVFLGDNNNNDNNSTNSTTSNATADSLAVTSSGLRLTKQQAAAIAAAAAVPAGLPAVSQAPLRAQAEPAAYKNMKPTADMQELERRIRAANAVNQAAVKLGATPTLASMLLGSDEAIGSSSDSSSGSTGGIILTEDLQLWRQLQQQYLWPDGQLVFDSLYSPWDVDSMTELRM